MQKTPTYIGIFVEDSKTANKQIRHYVTQALRQIVQTYEDAEQQVHLDLYNLEKNFKPPADNYHITTLFLGGNIKKLNQKQSKQFQSFKSNQKTLLKMDCIVYVPGYIIFAYCSNTDGIEVDNKFPHVTLFLGHEAKAVQSNIILESLAVKNPEIFSKKEFKTGKYNIEFNKFNSAYLVNKALELKGITGNNFTHGRK